MSIYDEIEIEDMSFDKDTSLFHFPCPCGDRFEISLAALNNGDDIAMCPSCSLMIKVIFEVDSLPKPDEPAKNEQPQQIPVAA